MRRVNNIEEINRFIKSGLINDVETYIPIELSSSLISSSEFRIKDSHINVLTIKDVTLDLIEIVGIKMPVSIDFLTINCNAKKLVIKNCTFSTIEVCGEIDDITIFDSKGRVFNVNNLTCRNTFLVNQLASHLNLNLYNSNDVWLRNINKDLVIVGSAVRVRIESINGEFIQIHTFAKFDVLNISLCTIEKLIMHEAEILESCVIKGNNRIDKVEITECNLNSIVFEDSRHDEILIGYQNNTRIDILTVVNQNHPFKLALRCSPNNLRILDSYLSILDFSDLDFRTSLPLENLYFSNVKIEKEIDLSYRIVKNSFINRVDLRHVKVNLYNANLSGFKYSNVLWANDYKIYEFDDLLNGKTKGQWLEILWGIKELYRQLKVSSIEQYNKIDAQLFQANEMAIYQRILTINLFGFRYDFSSRENEKFNWRQLSDWFLLTASKFITGHGLSWTRPLFWGFMLHGVLFCLLIDQRDLGVYFTTDLALSSWQDFWKGLGLFFQLFLPVHDSVIENVVTAEPVKIPMAIDFFMRVLSSFFIYYIIKGTRKFNFAI